MDIEGKDCCLV